MNSQIAIPFLAIARSIIEVCVPGLSLRKYYAFLGAALLLLVLLGELTLSVRRQSPAYDEAHHLFAGYMSWKTSDFGINPEHPPLVKSLAALPLLSMNLKVPPMRLNAFFKVEAYLDGRDFLFGNGGAPGADRILFRARMAAATLSLLLGLLLFLAAREIFGDAAALFSLALFVFEPNIIAHGAYVGTDMGVACFLFATIYALYRYVKQPSPARLCVLGLAMGFALACKHSAVILFPMVGVLILTEILGPQLAAPSSRKSRFLHLATAFVVATAIAVVILWSFYGFRFSARPAGMQLNPPLAEYVLGLPGIEPRIFLALARWRILPESYLYGMVDVGLLSASSFPTYIFGKIHAHGVWYYLPVAFIVKSTAAFLVLLLLSGLAIAAGRLRSRREILFLSIPPLLYLIVASRGGINIGARHLLPMFPFLALLIGGAMIALARQKRSWASITALLLLWHAVSASRSAPVYLAYSNEFWGGPANTYKYLTDSNTDWAQQLIAVRGYLDQRGPTDCYFAYFAEPIIQFRSYGIPCKPLPTANIGGFAIPPTVHGTVLISASTLSGFEFGSAVLNPYSQFQKLQPTAVIQHGVFVYDGAFDMRFASALGHVTRAESLLAAGRPGEALAEAQAAAQIDPEALQAQMILGDALAALRRPQESAAAYQSALSLATTMEPDIAAEWMPQIEQKLRP